MTPIISTRSVIEPNNIIDYPHAQNCAKSVARAAERTCGKADAVAELDQVGATFSLFHLLANADVVCIDSVEVTDVTYMDLDSGYEQVRLTAADEQEYFFQDQQVALLESGVLRATHCPQDGSEAANTYTLTLSVIRPMCATDLDS